MKTITVCIQCYNEVENVQPLSEAIIKQFDTFLPQYKYYIQFSDNHSTDGTREVLKKMCKDNPNIRAIFNVKNFGAVGRSGVNNLLQAEGDCVISMCSDFQDPPELLPEIVKKWEEGAKIVCCIKSSSKENKLNYFIRSFYYKIIQKFSAEVDQIEHFTGFGLYDREFIEVFRNLHDPHPVMRGIVAEFGYGIEKIEYEQPLRKAGKSKHNFGSLFDVAMWNFTTYTKSLRLATLGGMIGSIVDIVIAMIYFVLKLIYWNRFQAGMVPILLGIFLMGSIQLFFLGLLGEYIMAMNIRIINRPYVIEEMRLNFEEDSKENVIL